MRNMFINEKVVEIITYIISVLLVVSIILAILIVYFDEIQLAQNIEKSVSEEEIIQKVAIKAQESLTVVDNKQEYKEENNIKAKEEPKTDEKEKIEESSKANESEENSSIEENLEQENNVIKEEIQEKEQEGVEDSEEVAVVELATDSRMAGLLSNMAKPGLEEQTEVIVVSHNQEVEEQKQEIEREYNGYETTGKIEIPTTGVDLPILSNVTVGGMKVAPCMLYSTGELNKSGNTLIVGHNFRNNTLFSNNGKLVIGDKIYITDLDGNTVEYTIYSKFMTTAEDVSYIKRDTYNKPEITLSCCSDDESLRIIILAKVEN